LQRCCGEPQNNPFHPFHQPFPIIFRGYHNASKSELAEPRA
jgi:hypothetical protein